MVTKIIFVLLGALTVLIDARMTDEQMQIALSNSNPFLSHRRTHPVPVPQNVDVILPASDPDAHRVPVPQTSRAQITAGKPSFMTQSQSKPTTTTIRERHSASPSVPQTSFNDRQLNTRPIPIQEPSFQNKECSFQIPSFLMPDPNPSQMGSSLRCPSFLLPGPSINPDLVTLLVEHWTGVGSRNNQQLSNVRKQISQMEFEQKCLVPALRAHVLGGPACRSRELTVYLEWLLYLRQKLFNI